MNYWKIKFQHSFLCTNEASEKCLTPLQQHTNAHQQQNQSLCCEISGMASNIKVFTEQKKRCLLARLFGVEACASNLRPDYAFSVISI